MEALGRHTRTADHSAFPKSTTSQADADVDADPLVSKEQWWGFESMRKYLSTLFALFSLLGKQINAAVDGT